MAKSIRSKVKKRLRSVKRGVLKKDLQDPATKVGKAAAVVKTKLAEACTGFIKPPKRVYNAFRYDEPEAIIPQHDWRQLPDFRARAVGAEAGYALVGAKRPKMMHGGDAPTATAVFVTTPADAADADAMVTENEAVLKAASHVTRLQTGTHQYVPYDASRQLKRKLKRQQKSGLDQKAAHRWT